MRWWKHSAWTNPYRSKGDEMAEGGNRQTRVVVLIMLLILIPAVTIGADRLIEWLW
jgi:hypothetical protein